MKKSRISFEESCDFIWENLPLMVVAIIAFIVIGGNLYAQKYPDKIEERNARADAYELITEQNIYCKYDGTIIEKMSEYDFGDIFCKTCGGHICSVGEVYGVICQTCKRSLDDDAVYCKYCGSESYYGEPIELEAILTDFFKSDYRDALYCKGYTFYLLKNGGKEQISYNLLSLGDYNMTCNHDLKEVYFERINME